MFKRLKAAIDKEALKFLDDTKKTYLFEKISPLIFNNIKDFLLREGKRVRPILFVIGYKGFSKNPAANLYRSALAVELLHDFLLIHDDIIDKSPLRRGKPSMHVLLQNAMKKYTPAKSIGQDLAIILGDILYALAIESFLAIKEAPLRKEAALKKFTEATIYTGCGEFIETIYGLEKIKNISQEKIYQVYDYKTSYYTFCAPLTSAATLAGANKIEIDKLYQYGIYLGRAFQIKDDILGIFADEKKIGKSCLSDLKEAKKTILIWYAYNKGTKIQAETLENILSQKNITKETLLQTQKIIKDTGSLDYAQKEITRLLNQSIAIISSSKMKGIHKKSLITYSNSLLKGCLF